jgi:hypothetical protein
LLRHEHFRDSLADLFPGRGVQQGFAIVIIPNETKLDQDRRTCEPQDRKVGSVFDPAIPERGGPDQSPLHSLGELLIVSKEHLQAVRTVVFDRVEMNRHELIAICVLGISGPTANWGMVRVVVASHEHLDLTCPQDILQRQPILQSDVCFSEQKSVLAMNGAWIKNSARTIAHAMARIDANFHQNLPALRQESSAIACRGNDATENCDERQPTS